MYCTFNRKDASGQMQAGGVLCAFPLPPVGHFQKHAVDALCAFPLPSFGHLQKHAADALRTFPLPPYGSKRALLSKRRGFAFKAKARDRKSTRLNSSHVAISYAVFCLKKKISRSK